MRHFPREEFEGRLQRVRALMAERGCDALMVSSPENIYYLCGIEHQGYFACQLLLVAQEGPLVMIARELERSTVRHEAPCVSFVGYGDRSDGASPAAPAPRAIEVLGDLGLSAGTLGLELASNFLPHRDARDVMAGLPDAEWMDASGLVEMCRGVQSPRELAYTRDAARVSDAMMRAGVSAASPGADQADVMAAIYDAMFRDGGTYPGFVPLVRTGDSLTHEHSTLSGGRLEVGDALFLEMAGCVHRYHAPLGRLFFIGRAPPESERLVAVCNQAIAEAADRLAPGARACDVYQAWQERVDRAGLSHYARHHCGYAVGIGFPQSWVGSGAPRGLRPGADFELEPGMVFHLMSWLLRTGNGDAFASDTVVVTESGCEVLTSAVRDAVVL